MGQKNLTLHETMEVHELLNFKTVSLVKSKMVQGLVFDQDLKKLMEADVTQSIAAMKQLEGLLNKSETLQ